MPSLHDDLDERFSSFVDGLKELRESELDKVVFDRIYADLSILDVKSGALLQFISILVAAYAILTAGRQNLGPPLYVATLGVGGLFAVLSGVVALTLLWVRWSGAQKRPLDRARAIFRVRQRRTVRYRLAWLLGLAALCFLAVYVLLEMSTPPPS
jgi:hypothetical protein